MRFNHLIPPRTLGLLLALGFTFAFPAFCGSNTPTPPGRRDKLIEMSKGPCYGNCPVFTLTILENGLASYKGERNTDRLGTYVKKLDKSQMERLRREFKNANLFQYRDVYSGRIPDVQSVTITYYEGDRKKTISGKEVRPNAVKWLESILDQVANDPEGWVLKEAPQDDKPDYLIPNELVVELSEGITPEEWAENYIEADMIAERQFGDTGYWIFSFDDSLVAPDEMLEKVRTDENVLSAEFNKKQYDNLPEKKDGDDKQTGNAEKKTDKQQ